MSCVINNGWTSEFFSIERGVRQGCPLSPYLFIICVELFAAKIRSNMSIQGIVLGDREHKISQYADDTILYLNGTEQSLNEALSTLNKFEQISGLKVNFDKSKVFKIGTLRQNNVNYNINYHVTWSHGPIECLGVLIPLSVKENIFALNYEQKFSQRKCFSIFGQPEIFL